MSLFARIREAARKNPRSRALTAQGATLTYGGLVAAVERRAAALSREAGTRMLEGSNPTAFVVDFFAAGLAGRGAAAHPASAPEVLRSLREAELARFPPLPGSTVFYSSGSVGHGRAVPLTEGNLGAAALAFESWGEVTAVDRVAIGLSPAQIFGFVRGALNALAVGAEAIFFVPGRDPLEDAARSGATLALLPSAFVALAARHASRPALRALQCGGGAPTADVAETVERGRGVPVRVGYGLTESAGLAARQPLARPRRAGSAGLPAPGTTVAIVSANGRLCGVGEPGEIRLSGPAVFSGYASPEDPSPFDDDGRLRTGDVGLLDEAGELRVHGRLEFALASGDRVLCAEEVESAIAEHPSVAEVAVAPVDRGFGVLVVARDHATFEPDTIRAHAERRLPAFARPRRILGVAELPRTPVGKIDRIAATRWLTESSVND